MNGRAVPSTHRGSDRPTLSPVASFLCSDGRADFLEEASCFSRLAGCRVFLSTRKEKLRVEAPNLRFEQTGTVGHRQLASPVNDVARETQLLLRETATMVSVQRFRGTLAGRRGTFVLQGTETVIDGKINATWFVVPGSGTGELNRLRGEGGFDGEFGKGSKGWLDYWFE
jgi:uncharacterized protein DUF3224